VFRSFCFNLLVFSFLIGLLHQSLRVFSQSAFSASGCISPSGFQIAINIVKIAIQHIDRDAVQLVPVSVEEEQQVGFNAEHQAGNIEMALPVVTACDKELG
jgi:hypothetical protein